MRTKGRPRIGPVTLKNGFYIEVFNKGVKKGMKIRSESKKAMEDSAVTYSTYKDVNILGEYINGVAVSETPLS